MILKIKETTLNVLNAYAFRFQNGRLVLRVEVPQTEISHDALKELFKTNTEDITKTNDDGRVETFGGFVSAEDAPVIVKITDTTNENGVEVYEVEAECVAESVFQNAILRAKIAEQEAVISAQNENIASLTEQNSMLESCVLEMSEIVYA